MCAHLPRPAPRRVARRRWTGRAWSTATEGRREREGARMKTSQRKDGRDRRRRIGRRTKDGNVAPQREWVRERPLGSRGIASDLLGRPRCWAAVVRSVRDTRFADDVSPVSPYPLVGEGERERTSIEGTDREEEEEEERERGREEWAERMPLPNVVGGEGGREREGGRDAGCESERGQPRLRAEAPPRSNEVHRFCCRFHTRPPAPRGTLTRTVIDRVTQSSEEEGEKKRGSLAR